jgi:hypothetical protein
MKQTKHSIRSLMTTPEPVECSNTSSNRLTSNLKMKRGRALPLLTELAPATITAECKIYRKVHEGSNPQLTPLAFQLILRNLKNRKLISQ